MTSKLKSPIHALTWNVNGTFIATGSEKGVIEYWDTKTDTPLKQINTATFYTRERLPMTYKINSLDWNKDDLILVADESDNIIIWDIRIDQIILVLESVYIGRGDTEDLDLRRLIITSSITLIISIIFIIKRLKGKVMKNS